MEDRFSYILSVSYYQLTNIEDVIQKIYPESTKIFGIETRYYYTNQNLKNDNSKSYVVEECGKYLLFIKKKVTNSLFITSTLPIKEKTDIINYVDEKLSFVNCESCMATHYNTPENIIISCYIEQYLEITSCFVEIVNNKEKYNAAKFIIDTINEIK